MAVARAAAQSGHAHGATVVTARYRWDPAEALTKAASEGRWVIVDELDRTRPDRALGSLSTFLQGIPVGADSDEVVAADGWRLVATADHVPRGRIVRRFAVVEVAPPNDDELHAVLQQAAANDPKATRAAERLLPLREIAPLGTGVFVDAAKHAATRNAATPADEATLAREAFAAHIEPLLDDEQRERADQLLKS
jgi:hypothetical protein